MIEFKLPLLKGNSSFFGNTYYKTKSVVPFKHCRVELKKQVFPKFINPLKDNMKSSISSFVGSYF